jgi:hypothetical protein
MGNSEVYGGNIETINVTEIYEISVSTYFISEGQITKPKDLRL